MRQTANIICKRYREKNKETYYKRQKDHRETLYGRIRTIYQSAKDRARRKQIAFNLTIDELHALYLKQDGKCAVTNLEMEFELGTREKANNFCISLDRKIPELGYIIENVQLVCLAVNRIKWNFSEEEFKFWLRTISSQVLFLEERFTDYPEMEYISSEMEAPNSNTKLDEDIVGSI